MSANAPDAQDAPQVLGHQHHALPADVIPFRVPQQEPADGVQTSVDLVVKNALVLFSAGTIVAVAVWLLA